ncbi:MAG: hypothetical protein U0401_17680 [Anaerolineae bacterium]
MKFLDKIPKSPNPGKKFSVLVSLLPIIYAGLGGVLSIASSFESTLGWTHQARAAPTGLRRVLAEPRRVLAGPRLMLAGPRLVLAGLQRLLVEPRLALTGPRLVLVEPCLALAELRLALPVAWIAGGDRKR